MLIFAAISINSLTSDKIKKIILSGADVLRYNFSYRSPEENIERIKTAYQTIDELNSSVKILIDFPPNKVRLGDFDLKLMTVKEGEEIIFQSSEYSPDCHLFVPVQTTNLGSNTYVDQMITIGDGEISIQVTEIIDTNTIKARILNTGVIQAMKGFNIGQKIDSERITNQYQEIFKHLEQNDIEPNYIAIPFITLQISEDIIRQIPECCKKSKIIFKIEDRAGIDCLEEILKNPICNMIMMDRGEIGINVPFEKLGIVQKQIIKMAKKYNKLVIISTQILESTMNNYIPNRAEILDLTNIVLDGAGGVMFCKETGLGLRPAYTISVAKKIIQAVENNKYL